MSYIYKIFYGIYLCNISIGSLISTNNTENVIVKAASKMHQNNIMKKFEQ